MKETGIIRRMDDLGRIVIPKEIRRILQLHENDPIELYISGRAVVLKKYDCTKPVWVSLELLKEAVEDEPCLECRKDLLTKIEEMAVLLPQAE